MCHVFDPQHEDIKCTKPCARIHESCGHVCRKNCAQECGICPLPTQRDLPCGHNITVACGETQLICDKRCARPLRSCGHLCPRMCRDACGGCTVQYSKKFPACGHEVSYLCGTQAPVQCNVKCEQILGCGHRCRGDWFVSFGINND
jgi:hypothetical protein